MENEPKKKFKFKRLQPINERNISIKRLVDIILLDGHGIKFLSKYLSMSIDYAALSPHQRSFFMQ